MLDFFIDFVADKEDSFNYFYPLFGQSMHHRFEFDDNNAAPTEKQWERLFRLTTSVFNYHPGPISIHSTLGQIVRETNPWRVFALTDVSDVQYLDLVRQHPSWYSELPEHLKTVATFREAYSRDKSVKRELTGRMLRELLGLPVDAASDERSGDESDGDSC